MRLLIIASDSSGCISLAAPRAFADVAEATSELARLIDDGAVDVSASFYAFDMDVAVPVIVLRQPVSAPTDAPEVQEPMEEPWPSELPEEEPVEPEVLEVEPVDAEVLEEEPAAAELLDDEPVTAEVLVETPVDDGALDEPPVEPEVAEQAPAEAEALEEAPVDAAVLEAAPVDSEPEVVAEAETDPVAGVQWPWDLPVIPEEGTADEIDDEPVSEVPAELESAPEMAAVPEIVAEEASDDIPIPVEFEDPAPAALAEVEPLPDAPADAELVAHEPVLVALPDFAFEEGGTELEAPVTPEPEPEVAPLADIIDFASLDAAVPDAPLLVEPAADEPVAEEVLTAVEAAQQEPVLVEQPVEEPTGDEPAAPELPEPDFDVSAQADDLSAVSSASDDATDARIELLAAALAAADTPVADVAEAPQPVAVVPMVAEPHGVLDATASIDAAASGSGIAYEPGALNMNEYTCADCVYVNTCPNRDQKKPAECGSFQWKA